MLKVLAEARDYLLQLTQLKLDSKSKLEEIQGTLFAPVGLLSITSLQFTTRKECFQCPHSSPCPRYFHDTIPCNFDVRYKPFQLLKIPQEVRDRAAVHRFSYLVFKKGASDTFQKTIISKKKNVPS